MTCPKCDGHLDAYVQKSWGDGVQKQRYAPFICSLCASVMLIDLDANALVTGEEVKRITLHDLLDVLQSNRAAWEAIEAHRKLILSAPKRRPVLR